MIKAGGSIIDGEREDFLFTYDEEEKQQNEINRETAKLVYAPEFIPLKPKFLDIFTSKEAIILSFIGFYKKSGGARMYFTNEQLAGIARCSEDVVSKAISKFIKMGYIKVSRKVKSGGGQIRFINEYNESPEGEELRLRKKLSQTKEKQGTNKNKINKNNIYIKEYNNPKENHIKNNNPFSEEKKGDIDNSNISSSSTIDNVQSPKHMSEDDIEKRKEKSSAKKEKKKISQQNNTWNGQEKFAFERLLMMGVNYTELETDNYPSKVYYIIRFIDVLCDKLDIEVDYSSDTINVFGNLIYGQGYDDPEYVFDKSYTDNVYCMYDLLANNKRFNDFDK